MHFLFQIPYSILAAQTKMHAQVGSADRTAAQTMNAEAVPVFQKCMVGPLQLKDDSCTGGSLCNRPTCRARHRTTASNGMHQIASSCTSYTDVYLATRGCRCSLGTRPTTHWKVVRPRPDQPERRRCLCRMWCYILLDTDATFCVVYQ